MPTDARPTWIFLISCVVLAAVIGLNAWLFQRFGHTSYFEWYLANGTMIGLGVTFLSLIFEELELQRDLISAHPLRYLAGCASVAGIFFLALSVHYRSPVPAQPGQPADSPAGRVWDQLVMVLLGIPIFAVVIAWLLVVAPMNYFVTLVSGAPARHALRGLPTRCVVVDRDNHVTVIEEPADQPLREGAVDVSLGRKPFALTQGLTALILFLVEIGRELLA